MVNVRRIGGEGKKRRRGGKNQKEELTEGGDEYLKLTTVARTVKRSGTLMISSSYLSTSRYLIKSEIKLDISSGNEEARVIRGGREHTRTEIVSPRPSAAA